MELLAVSLMLVAALAVPVSRALTGDYFSPPAIVIIAWCGTLGLYALRLLPYPPLSDATLALIAGTIALLVFGSVMGIWWAARRQPSAPGAIQHRSASEPPRPAVSPSYPARWTTIYALAGLGGTLWYVRDVVTILGPEAFRNGDGLRAALNVGQIPGTFLFLQYFALASALLAYALWQTRRLRARHLILPGLCALGTLITTDRTQSFTLIVSAGFIAAFALGPRLRAWKLIAAGTLLPLLLALNFVAVGVWRGQSWRMFQAQVSGAPNAPGAPDAPRTVWQGPARQLSMLYFYLTASYPALDRLMRDPHPRTHGQLTLFPIARALERLHVIEGPLPPYIPAFMPVTQPAAGAEPLFTNASTFLYYPLEDFGPPGALAYAWLVGLASGWAYGWMRRDRSSPARLLLIGQISTALLLTIFVNKFNNTGSWYVLLLTLAPFVFFWRWRPAKA